jgi:2,3-bisphosphoglycerate-dependent phosphoglycerate mutase
MSTPATLVLLRHGESTWNALNQFTGWVDVDLSEKGVAEATRGGALLKESGVLPDVVHTSLLRRAIRTANIALDGCDRHWIPVIRNWRLNERHYGALQGKNKKQTLEAYGEEQFMLWRRSYDTPPPPLDDSSEFSQAADPRYADLGDELPRTECLKDVIARFLPYWEDVIVPDLRAVRSCSSPRTATRCARWSSTSTASPTTTSPGSTSPPASRWSTASTATCTRWSPAGSTSTPRRRPQPLRQ